MTGEVHWVLARRGTPPGQGGRAILARDDCGRPFDHAARVPAVSFVWLRVVSLVCLLGTSTWSPPKFLGWQKRDLGWALG